jgi:ribonuclease Z
MIFTGDTKPERLTKEQASNSGAPIDVLIHEMGVPPEVWAMKMGRGTDPRQVSDAQFCEVKKIQSSSHTTQGAFGYLLSQISPYPRLTVATHFPTADDTVQCAMKSLKEHLPKVYQGERPNPTSDAPRVTFAFDLMVITVSPDRILEQRGVIDLFGYQAGLLNPPAAQQATPKYHCSGATGADAGDPLQQINSSTTLWPCGNGTCQYRTDGY